MTHVIDSKLSEARAVPMVSKATTGLIPGSCKGRSSIFYKDWSYFVDGIIQGIQRSPENKLNTRSFRIVNKLFEVALPSRFHQTKKHIKSSNHSSTIWRRFWVQNFPLLTTSWMILLGMKLLPHKMLLIPQMFLMILQRLPVQKFLSLLLMMISLMRLCLKTTTLPLVLLWFPIPSI